MSNQTPQHTPGTWRVLPLEGKYYGTVVDLGGNTLIVWTTDWTNPVPSEREVANGWEPDYGMDHVEDARTLANARLIAAAPEGYAANHEALRFLEHIYDHGYRDDVIRGVIEKLRAAVAKADGRAE